MPTQVDSFFTKFGADFRELLAEYRKAERETQKFRGTIQKEIGAAQAALGRFGSTIKGALAGAIGAFSVGKIISAARETMRWAEALEQQARWLGIGVERLQAWEHGAREAGIEQGKLGQALEKMRGNLADAAADPNSGPAQIFRQLGIEIRDAQGQLKGLEQLVPEFADKIKGLGTGDKLIVGKTLFGDRMDDMVRFFEGGAAGLRRIEEAARAAGVVMEESNVKRAAALNREFDLMAKQIDIDLKQALVELGPVLITLIKLVADLAREFTDILKALDLLPETVQGKISRLRRQEGRLDEGFEAVFGPRAAKIVGPQAKEALRKRILDLEAEQATADETRAHGTGLPAPPKPPPDRLRTGGAGAADRFLKQILAMRREAEALQTELRFDRPTAEFEKLLQAFKEGDGTIRPTKKQVEEFGAALERIEGLKAEVHLKDMAEQASRLAQVTAAEVAGNRDLVAVLEARFQAEDKLGKAAAARMREAIEARALEMAAARARAEIARLDPRQDFQRRINELVDLNRKGLDSHQTLKLVGEAYDDLLSKSDHWRDGAIRGLRAYAKEATDAAKAFEDGITAALQASESHLTDFFVKGRFDFKSFEQAIRQDLTRIAVRQAITGPLAQAMIGLFGGSDVGIGSLQASSHAAAVSITSLAAAAQAAAAALTNVAVNGSVNSGAGVLSGFAGTGSGSSFDGIGGFFRGIGKLLDGSFFPAFAEGGSFRVGGAGGIDSQLVQFWATPGEEVEVRRPGQRVQGDTFVMNVHGARDFDSFRRNESQIFANAATMMQRARQRSR